MRGWQYYSQKIGKNENILDFWHKTENILYLATRLFDFWHKTENIFYLATRLWARLTFVC